MLSEADDALGKQKWTEAKNVNYFDKIRAIDFHCFHFIITEWPVQIEFQSIFWLTYKQPTCRLRDPFNKVAGESKSFIRGRQKSRLRFTMKITIL